MTARRRAKRWPVGWWLAIAIVVVGTGLFAGRVLGVGVRSDRVEAAAGSQTTVTLKATATSEPSQTAAPAQEPTTPSVDPAPPVPVVPAKFDEAKALKDITALAKIGVRKSERPTSASAPTSSCGACARWATSRRYAPSSFRAARRAAMS